MLAKGGLVPRLLGVLFGTIDPQIREHWPRMVSVLTTRRPKGGRGHGRLVRLSGQGGMGTVRSSMSCLMRVCVCGGGGSRCRPTT